MALDKELNVPEFQFLTLRMKAIKPTLCFIPAVELNDVPEVPSAVPNASGALRQ